MKEAYYFSHDYESTGDPKIQALLGEYGGLGYGVFWRVVEMLHSEETHRLPLKQYVFLAIAKQMLTSAEQIQAMINFAIHTLELFSTDGEFFWSDRVNRNFLRRQEISEKRAVAGRAGAIAKQNLAKPGKGKERKEKEIKEYSPNSDEIRISELLFSLISERDQKAKKPDFQKWAVHIDRLIRIDKRDPGEIRNVIEWSQNDSFWQNNILSTEKLRKQFGQLALKMKKVGKQDSDLDQFAMGVRK